MAEVYSRWSKKQEREKKESVKYQPVGKQSFCNMLVMNHKKSLLQELGTTGCQAACVP